MKRLQQHLPQHLSVALSLALCGVALNGVGNVRAQILPDNTLGSESSIVTPINPQLEQIDGGAIRGSNLFQSFLEFNINEGAAAYFANPVGIENIFSRVTGSNPSYLFGTLGVFGDANLYFLNPNGMIFGPNARLDLSGSFFASTANSLVFPDGSQFGVTDPEALPLLTVEARSPIGLRFEGSEAGAIVNAGALETGENLTLVGGTVISTGQLLAPKGEIAIATVPQVINHTASVLSELLSSVEEDLGVTVTDAGNVILTESGLAVEPGDIALVGTSDTASVRAETATLAAANTLTLVEAALQTTGNLNLLALDTVRIRDSERHPFLAQAGGNLTIQGNQNIDILALNHPQTPFESVGNLSLTSDGIISGDAHFSSGGTFSVLNLSGEPGEFISLYDPIISSESDVVLGDYTGVSLKIESRGSITTEDITITEPDTSLPAGSDDPDIPILTSSPALILRAGVDELQNPPTVYWNNFTGNVGPEWSNTSVDKTPNDDRSFLGQFGNDTVSLILGNLPAHSDVTISFTLFTIRSWDGNRTDFGPDIWTVNIVGNLTPFSTTFTNDPINSPFFKQAYPGRFPNEENFPRTGASENDSLGYQFGNNPLDAVYQLSETFPHSQSSLQIDFSAQLTEGLDDESWGITNVNISLPNVSPETVISQPTTTFPGTQSSGTITTGNLFTPNGSIVLSAASDITLNGSITSQGGKINLNSGGSIDTRRGDIDSFSILDGGEIIINADRDIFAGNIRSSGDRLGGNITLNSQAGIYMDGTDVIRSDTFGTDRGGDINVTAQSLVMTNGARMLTGTLNDGVGGNLNVTAERVELSGYSADGQILTSLSTATGGSEPAGDLMIDVRQLIVRDGAGIAAATVGAGQGGDLIVKDAELVELSGTSITGFPSGLNTDSLGTGNAGNLIVNTGRFIARNGAAASASTYARGRGGNLIVNAASVELSGTSREGFASGLYAQAFGDGNAGNLTLNAGDVTVRDGAKVTVAAGTAADARVPNLPSLDTNIPTPSFDPNPTGNAGNITVNAHSIFLDRQGQIIAQTDSSEGGNITLNVRDYILLRRNSTISATAGTARAGGNGGNIRIDAPFILAIPQENSDITANAFLGNGGRISISARGIYGLQFRPRLTPFSDITASSEFGVDGIVEIDALNIDPTRGLANLPTNAIASDIIVGCFAGGALAEVEYFEIGRGGLTATPDDPFGSTIEIPEWIPFDSKVSNSGAAFASFDTATREWSFWGCQGRRTR
jgi:filamentous hemagglutinin family protein